MSEWFNAKVEGLLAVGKTIWSLVTGELGFAEIGRMAWQAVQALIPPTLTRILIEKLVAMIVPAAGALLAVVEALQAAWGTVSRVIASLDLFVAFLKAVKGGGAGAKFAAALASAAIVVLDFVANYLIAKLGRGLRALSGKLKGIASRLMKKKRGAKAKRGRSTGRARGKRKPKTLRTKGQTARSRRKDLNQRKRKKDHKAEDLRNARRVLGPRIRRMMDKGVNRDALRAQLSGWRIQYRLRRLSLNARDDVIIGNSPDSMLVDGHRLSSADVRFILNFVRSIARRVERDHERGAVTIKKRVSEAQQTGSADSIDVSDVSLPSIAKFFRDRKSLQRGQTTSFQLQSGYVASSQAGGFQRLDPKAHVFIKNIPEKGTIVPGISGLMKEDPEQAAAAMQALAAGRKVNLTGALAGREDQLAGASLLLFGLEPSRNRSSLVTGVMATDLVAQGVDPDEALGMLPMAEKGAMRANRQVEQFREGEKTLEELRGGGVNGQVRPLPGRKDLDARARMLRDRKRASDHGEWLKTRSSLHCVG